MSAEIDCVGDREWWCDTTLASGADRRAATRELAYSTAIGRGCIQESSVSAHGMVIAGHGHCSPHFRQEAGAGVSSGAAWPGDVRLRPPGKGSTVLAVVMKELDPASRLGLDVLGWHSGELASDRRLHQPQ